MKTGDEKDFVSVMLEFFPQSMQRVKGFTKCSWYGRLHVEREVEVTSRVSHCVKSWMWRLRVLECLGM